ncbi:hypothetical protein P3L10_017246 [Capsicum annuum]
MFSVNCNCFMSCLIASLQYFFGLPLLLLKAFKANLSHLLTGVSVPLPITCPNHLNLTSRILSSTDVTPTFSRIVSFLTLPTLVSPHIHHNLQFLDVRVLDWSTLRSIQHGRTNCNSIEFVFQLRSLGLTQLDTNAVVGFVPEVFNYEEPNFVENISKFRNNPNKMKEIRKTAGKKSKKTVEKSSRLSKKDDSGRPRLPKGMKYRIRKVPAHSLHFGSYCNRKFGEEIKNYLGEEVVNLFRQIIFGSFLDIPNYNYQGQLSKCLLMLEIEQDNPDEIHFYVPGTTLKFTIIKNDSTIAERMGNVIPQIFNWQVVGTKVKYEKFMAGMFSKLVYNNIRPTDEEVQSLDLQMIEGFQLKDVESGFPPKIVVDYFDKKPVVDVQSQVDLDIQGFEVFSTVPPTEILKKAGLITDSSTSHPSKKRKIVRFDSTTIEEKVCQKTPSFVSTRTVPTQKTASSGSEHVHAEKTTPSSSLKSVCQDNSDEKWDDIKLFL